MLTRNGALRNMSCKKRKKVSLDVSIVGWIPPSFKLWVMFLFLLVILLLLFQSLSFAVAAAAAAN